MDEFGQREFASGGDHDKSRSWLPLVTDDCHVCAISRLSALFQFPIPVAIC